MRLDIVRTEPRCLHDEIADAFGTVRLLRQIGDHEWRTSWTVTVPQLQASGSPQAAVKLLRRGLATVAGGTNPAVGWQLTVPSLTQSGFAIDLMHKHGRYRALFGDMEIEFCTLDEAMSWVAPALSEDYRLRTVLIGDKPREWYLEPCKGSRRADDSLTCGQPVLLSFLWRKSVVIRSNTFHRQ